MTLQFDAASATLGSQLKPDQFADMVRTQSIENGTDIIVLGLWGDLEVLPTIPAYLQMLQKSVSPLYKKRGPTSFTVSQGSKASLVLLFEEPAGYLNLATRRPSQEWWNKYLKSYYRLGTNRPTGFGGSQSGYGPSSAKRVGQPSQTIDTTRRLTSRLSVEFKGMKNRTKTR